MSTYVGYIYCITNRVTGKQYIGQTNTTVKRRYTEHLRCATSSKDTTSLLYCAMRKYGVDNFSVESLESVTSDSKDGLKSILNDREIFYVASKNTYKPNGYNMTAGGYAFAEHVAVPVVQVLSSGEIIAFYASMQDAESALDIPYGSIKRALHSNAHYANGFFWYQNENNQDRVGSFIGEQQRNDITAVYQFNLSGELIQSFSSLTEAEHETGINHAKISAVCSGRRKSTGGYVWSYYPVAASYTSAKSTHRRRAVTQMDMDGNIIQTYPSATNAAEELGLQQALISKCCNGQRKSTGGYRWAFLLPKKEGL